MDYKRKIVCAIVMCCITLLFSIDLDDFYQQVHSRFDSISTLQADIAQTNEYAQSKTKLTSSGVLYYKPNNLILDYSKPHIQKLIIQGNKVQMYDKESKTLIKTTNNQGVSNPMQIVDKYWTKSRKELISEDSVSIRVRLFPSSDENIKKIEVSFNNRTKMISELSYWDKLGNKVRFRFQNIRIGIAIQSSKWTFTPPHGVNVIQQ